MGITSLRCVLLLRISFEWKKRLIARDRLCALTRPRRRRLSAFMCYEGDKKIQSIMPSYKPNQYLFTCSFGTQQCTPTGGFKSRHVGGPTHPKSLHLNRTLFTSWISLSKYMRGDTHTIIQMLKFNTNMIFHIISNLYIIHLFSLLSIHNLNLQNLVFQFSSQFKIYR